MHIETDETKIDWELCAYLYALTLATKPAQHLKTAFENSMYKCFLFEGEVMIGAGRVVADGVDCAYLCDVFVHPKAEGRGYGKKIVTYLMEQAKDHDKIILYANIGKEGFYEKLGFKKMTTAMALFQNQDLALEKGYIE